MKKKVECSMTWDEAPDTIGPLDLAKILGIGENAARAKFEEKGFPKIKGIGNSKKADKDMTRIYLQGINVKENSKETMVSLLLFEIKKLNTKLDQMMRGKVYEEEL